MSASYVITARTFSFFTLARVFYRAEPEAVIHSFIWEMEVLSKG